MSEDGVYAPLKISIHSLRMEGDAWSSAPFSVQRYFNPLPPHGGRRRIPAAACRRCWHFNPLPPHGGRRVVMRLHQDNGDISIHSLRMEGDTMQFSSSATWVVFQSTPSAWRETWRRQGLSFSVTYFNPLPPHGGRQF